MDPLTEVLRVSGVRGALGNRLEAGGHWALGLDDHPGAALHAVTGGGAWLTVPGREPVQLAAGDVVLLPPETRHGLGNAPDTAWRKCDRAAAARSRKTGGVMRLGTLPSDTSIVTMHYECNRTALTQVLTTLPEIMHVSGSATGLDDAVRMLGRELAHPQMATTALLDSLVDVMLVHLLRAWLPTRPDRCRGTWLGMLGDPVATQAVERLHEDPARPWTTASLASAIAVSRATLARRFPAAVGETPAAYLARWRMDLAARRLRETHDPVMTVATAVGYQSVPAFTRAFTRAYGRTPGRYRTEARSVDDPPPRSPL